MTEWEDRYRKLATAIHFDSAGRIETTSAERVLMLIEREIASDRMVWETTSNSLRSSI